MPTGEPFGVDQRGRLIAAVRAARHQTGMHFSVYVGPVTDNPREFAEAELAGLMHLGPEVVLIAVGPAERELAIVTSPAARRRLPDHGCALAALSMSASFGLGDLVGGVVLGLRMLADATSPARAETGLPAAAPRP